jgi:hypothetical protein
MPWPCLRAWSYELKVRNGWKADVDLLGSSDGGKIRTTF